MREWRSWKDWSVLLLRLWCIVLMLVNYTDWRLQAAIMHRLLTMSRLRLSVIDRLVHTCRRRLRLVLVLGIYWRYALLGSSQMVLLLLLMLHRDLLVVIVVRTSPAFVFSSFWLINLRVVWIVPLIIDTWWNTVKF